MCVCVCMRVCVVCVRTYVRRCVHVWVRVRGYMRLCIFGYMFSKDY